MLFQGFNITCIYPIIMTEKNAITIIRVFLNNMWLVIDSLFKEMKQNIKETSIAFILLVGTIIVSYLFSIVVNSEALKTLVQAEATFFGFFGILFVYALKQYDDEFKELRKSAFELNPSESNQKLDSGDNIVQNLEGMINEIREKKRTLVKAATDIGVAIIGSMLISVWLIGSVDSISSTGGNWLIIGTIRFLSYFTIALFLVAIYKFLDLLNKMAEET